MNSLSLLLKATRQLGPLQVGYLALYKLGLWSGYYRRVTKTYGRQKKLPSHVEEVRPLLTLPQKDLLQETIGKEGWEKLRNEAEELLDGKVRLFGAEPVELRLSLPGQLGHWTDYERGKTSLPEGQHPDIKFTWEPARFGWVFVLGRAYHLSGDERYPVAFWKYFEIFDRANPANTGPQWMSGQEVALRLMAFCWAGQVFDKANSSTAERKRRLAEAVAEHARRIPTTLIYARAQHNNHLLTEASGLLTAGLALPEVAEAREWRESGWKWLNKGLQSQIDAYGEYSQHSCNYHRLMLQTVLWVQAVLKGTDLHWPGRTREALTKSIHWMLSLLDDESGHVPNLGANDGALILPLSTCPFENHRPTLHAAARAFLDYDLPHGEWDEEAHWLDAGTSGRYSLSLPRYLGDQLYGKDSWAYFRTAQFHSHPSHADQLHLDLWWRGINITLDAGSYLYNGEKPWENALCNAFVHNTVTVNQRDQMARASRFLYLDWVNAYRASVPAEGEKEVQRVRGRYRGQGYRHTRIVSVNEEDQWLVRDEILSLATLGRRRISARLHWLLPDWEWKFEKGEEGITVLLKSSRREVKLEIRDDSRRKESDWQVTRCRAGEQLVGSEEADPTRGWISPTYGVKNPALSLAVETEGETEIRFSTTFTLTSGKR